jgi:hypothetical protein
MRRQSLSSERVQLFHRYISRRFLLLLHHHHHRILKGSSLSSYSSERKFETQQKRYEVLKFDHISF